MRLTLGTRASALALAQTELARRALAQAWPLLEVEVRRFTTRGDQKLDLSLIRESAGGAKGLFTKELEDALLAREIDVAVHSLKDLPGAMPAGLALVAVLERAAPGDVLISKTAAGFDALPDGARIGTSSIRRARQLAWLRHDLVIEEFRGNVQTRLRKLGQSDTLAAIVLAEAGLARLGFALAGGVLEFEEWRFHVEPLATRLLPAIGQGVIALQARAGDLDTAAALAAINDPTTFTCVRAERELQRLLAGDCTLPVGVRTHLDSGTLHLEAILFVEGETNPRRAETHGPADAAEALAREIAAALERGAFPPPGE